MGKWLRLTALRAIICLLVLAAAVAFLFWLPSHTARSLIKTQLEQADSAISKLNEAQNLLDTLPVLNQVQTQQVGSIKAYAVQAQKSANSFNQLNINNPSTVSSLIGTGQLVKDANQAVYKTNVNNSYRAASQDIALADKIFDYHAAVSEALVNVLEYNPKDDIKNFIFNSDDTKQRLEAARQGLVKTDDKLLQAKRIYNEPSIDEVTALISRLRYARYQLSQNGDTAAWISRVDDSQSRIVNNRTNFWSAESKKLAKKLQADATELRKTQAAWKNLAAEYNIR
jgi:hypothetical protein